PLPPPPLIPVQPPPQYVPALPPATLPETPLPLLEPAPPPPGPVELRERTLYFTQVDRGGSIFRTGVNRSLPLSATPMTDVLHALIDGPSEDERRRGIISLIPAGTQILSATVRAETAYINFTEDFLYNTYGADGYVGQLRQVVYTVTEFPNVNDVQILIEGQRVDFLGKGIWIGSPVRRGMF
ncbi:MAG: GerMN domain-containing protein, partial [Treponema sp.]|nr:GerMN domain-containing protein [Treponema sp.]